MCKVWIFFSAMSKQTLLIFISLLTALNILLPVKVRNPCDLPTLTIISPLQSNEIRTCLILDVIIIIINYQQAGSWWIEICTRNRKLAYQLLAGLRKQKQIQNLYFYIEFPFSHEISYIPNDMATNDLIIIHNSFRIEQSDNFIHWHYSSNHLSNLNLLIKTLISHSQALRTGKQLH